MFFNFTCKALMLCLLSSMPRIALTLYYVSRTYRSLFFFQETTLYKLVELFQYTTPIKSQLKILAFEKDDKGIFLTFHLCVFSVSP